jgi:hypothetical protein
MSEVKIVQSTPELMQAVATAVASRRLVTFRIVDAIEPIEGADAIEVAVIGGWKVVTKKNEFRTGDPCVYFEIDSFLPDGVPAWQFLIDKSSRMFEGAKGHKLRTIKLRGQVSQGLILPLHALPVLDLVLRETLTEEQARQLEVSDPVLQAEIENLRYGLHVHEAALSPQDLDLTALLGVKKFEIPLPACLQGQAAGTFPSFIRKTDQERCQNLTAEIFGYANVTVPFNVDGMTNEVVNDLVSRGVIKQVHGERGVEYQKILMAKGDRNARYEVTIKLDGSSGTFFVKNTYDENGLNTGVPTIGACSRNLELKINDENAGNTYVRVLNEYGLGAKLEKFFMDTGRAIAVQGEIMGPGIQGNREDFKDIKFFVFDIFDIDNQCYVDKDDRHGILAQLDLPHVPILHESTTLDELGITTVAQLLAFAEGPSIAHKIREGLVFKRIDGGFSFKAISNAFLAKEKD